ALGDADGDVREVGWAVATWTTTAVSPPAAITATAATVAMRARRLKADGLLSGEALPGREPARRPRQFVATVSNVVALNDPVLCDVTAIPARRSPLRLTRFWAEPGTAVHVVPSVGVNAVKVVPLTVIFR